MTGFTLAMVNVEEQSLPFQKVLKKHNIKKNKNMNFKIKRTVEKNTTYEIIVFQAVDSKGKRIFGARAELHRWLRVECARKSWTDWMINYGSCGEQTYGEKLPHVMAINKAMEELKKLSK